MVGEGLHARAGGPHAERVALDGPGRGRAGATLYVNLEPCAHHAKRTPPCAPALAAAGVRRVVAAMRDPNPAVSGRGLALLRRAGIAVTNGRPRARGPPPEPPFVVAQAKQRPFVLLKAALTLDGRIATAAGESKWITSPAQRRAARALRRLHDAVLVGIGTVLADDPMLLPAPRTHRPFLRVVLDSRLRLPLESRLVRTRPTAPVIVLCGRGHAARRAALEARGVTVLSGPRREAASAVRWALRALWSRGPPQPSWSRAAPRCWAPSWPRAWSTRWRSSGPRSCSGAAKSRPAFGGPGPTASATRCGSSVQRSGRLELWIPEARLAGQAKSVVN